MFSLGVILYTMIACEFPFNGSSVDELSKEIRNKEPKFGGSFNNVSLDCKDLIKKLLVKDKTIRITVDEALDHPWFKNEAINEVEMDQATKDKALKSITSYTQVSKL